MEIVVVAMTKVNNKVCFAGINPDDNSWVRPVCDEGAWSTITYEGTDFLVEVGDVMRLEEPIPQSQPPHIEDVQVSSFSYVRSTTPEEFRALLQQNIDYEAFDNIIIGKGNQSLCVIQPLEFKTVYVESYDEAKTRLAFWIDDKCFDNKTQKPGFPCTDLRWRAYRRENDYDPEICDYDDAYLALGLSRHYKWGYHPMVISVITFPSFEFTLDPENL